MHGAIRPLGANPLSALQGCGRQHRLAGIVLNPHIPALQNGVGIQGLQPFAE